MLNPIGKKLLASLREMVETYREGCADEDEPSMVITALQTIEEAEKIDALG